MTLAELRAEVQRLRDANYDNASALESEGKPGSERAFGRVEALDRVLALIDDGAAS